MTMQSSFLTQLNSLLDLSDELRSLRSLAWEKLQEIGLPTAKHEAFQFMKLKAILSLSYNRPSLSKIDLELIKKAKLQLATGSYLVFYNGHFLHEHSNVEDERVVLKPLNQASQDYGIFFKNQFQKWVKEEKDPFVLMSMALHANGAFLYIPNQHQLKEPIAILEINDSSSVLTVPFLIASCGKNSQFNLIHQVIGKASISCLATSSAFFVMEPQAKVSYVKHIEDKEHARLDAIRVEQKKESTFSSVILKLNVKKARHDIRVQLLESHAQAEVVVLAALKNDDEAHTHILIEHKAEDCQSRQLVKNIYDDKSMGSFEGKIWVDSIAQKTNAYQLNQNCLLSDQAMSYSKPNLEIFADDVKASHGSTTGQLNKEHLFYLQSRGLSLDTARQMILKAFCHEIIEKIELKFLKENVEQDLKRYFSK